MVTTLNCELLCIKHDAKAKSHPDQNDIKAGPTSVRHEQPRHPHLEICVLRSSALKFNIFTVDMPGINLNSFCQFGFFTYLLIFSYISVTSSVSFDLTELRNKVAKIKVNPRGNLWATGKTFFSIQGCPFCYTHSVHSNTHLKNILFKWVTIRPFT